MKVEEFIGKQVKVRNTRGYNGIYTLERVYHAPSGVRFCDVKNEKFRIAVPAFDVVAVDGPDEMTETEKYFYSYF